MVQKEEIAFEDDEQRRRWFATHPEYSRSYQGGENHRQGKKRLPGKRARREADAELARINEQNAIESEPFNPLDCTPIRRVRFVLGLAKLLKSPRLFRSVLKALFKRKARDMTRGTVINWRKGDNPFDKTTKGNRPTWSSVRWRLWTNEARKPGAVDKWGAKNVEKMKNGRAPKVTNPETGVEERVHWHHPKGRQGEGWREVEPVPEGTHYDIHYPKRRKGK